MSDVRGRRPPSDRGGMRPTRPPPGSSPSGALRPQRPQAPSGMAGLSGSVRPPRALRPLPARGPVVRSGTFRLPQDIAQLIWAGHPWVFRDALGDRPVRENTGDIVELVDPAGNFVGRGFYDSTATIAVRVFTRDAAEALGPGLITRRVRDAVSLRRRFVRDTNALRLVNAESDGLPGITVDRYADYLVVQIATPAVLAVEEALLDALEAEVKPKAIYMQRRFRSLAGDAPTAATLARGTAAPVELEVEEGPLRFWVDVTAPLSTGLFPDLRLGRRAIGGWASGRRVLNLFSYSGAVSVWAQHGGAASVVAVDSSARAHARARKNFALNGFDPEKPEHIVGDVFKVLAKLAERGRTFDLIVMDPPAFGTGGGQTFSAAQDYRELVAETLRLLAPGAVLVAVSSTHRITHEDFDRALAEGAARASGSLRIVERLVLPPDFCVAPGFPEGNYLKGAVCIRD